MNTKRVPVNSGVKSFPPECSVEAVSERLFERSLSFGEIAELSEKCGLWEIGKKATKSVSRPFTFVVPAVQLVASVSRIVE
jgi:hypothetical protein